MTSKKKCKEEGNCPVCEQRKWDKQCKCNHILDKNNRYCLKCGMKVVKTEFHKVKPQTQPECKKHNQEDLWDFICSQVGFDKEGKETQKAIKLFISNLLEKKY